jgi:glycosyltransferase involved in cell wall biosynthesis
MVDVSICMITYNHEDFIQQSIESIIEQETKFSFELVISDDGSKDNTANICSKMAAKYPDKIRFEKNDTNIGMMPNFIKALRSCLGKYIALCEGDDYWIDKAKIEKTVTILERHPEYTICCHGNYKLINNKLHDDNILNLKGSSVFTLECYLIQPFFHTSSIVFRSADLISSIPDWYKDVFAGDNFLVALLGHKGKIFYMAQIMSVYRIHTQSISNKYGVLNMKDNYFKYLGLFNEMNNYQYSECIEKVKKKWELITNCYNKNYLQKVVFYFKNIRPIFKVYKPVKIKIKLALRYLIPTSLLK